MMTSKPDWTVCGDSRGHLFQMIRSHGLHGTVQESALHRHRTVRSHGFVAECRREYLSGRSGRFSQPANCRRAAYDVCRLILRHCFWRLGA